MSKKHARKWKAKQAGRLAKCFKAVHDGAFVRGNDDQSGINAELPELVTEALVVFADPRTPQDARKITIEAPEDLPARLTELLKRTTIDKQRAGATSHGALTVGSLLTTPTEDCGVVISRPGSWGGANMVNFLASHGYDRGD
jgi:hypothetical protein